MSRNRSAVGHRRPSSRSPLLGLGAAESDDIASEGSSPGTSRCRADASYLSGLARSAGVVFVAGVLWLRYPSVRESRRRAGSAILRGADGWVEGGAAWIVGQDCDLVWTRWRRWRQQPLDHAGVAVRDVSTFASTVRAPHCSQREPTETTLLSVSARNRTGHPPLRTHHKHDRP